MEIHKENWQCHLFLPIKQWIYRLSNNKISSNTINNNQTSTRYYQIIIIAYNHYFLGVNPISKSLLFSCPAVRNERIFLDLDVDRYLDVFVIHGIHFLRTQYRDGKLIISKQMVNNDPYLWFRIQNTAVMRP